MNPFLSGSGEVLTLALPVKYSSTPVEVVDFKDVRALKKLLSILVE
jgi:putative aminopeptidase FrvX